MNSQNTQIAPDIEGADVYVLTGSSAPGTADNDPRSSRGSLSASGTADVDLGPDAELIAQAHFVEYLSAQEDHLHRHNPQSNNALSDDDPVVVEWNARLDRVTDRFRAAIAKLADMHAVTPAGVRAKASAMLKLEAMLNTFSSSFPEELSLLRSMADDAIRLGSTPVSADAELAALFALWRKSANEEDAADNELARLQTSTPEVDWPEELYDKPNDRSYFGCELGIQSDGRRWYGSETSIKKLEILPLRNFAALRRRDEIVSAYEKREAQVKAVEEVSGITAAKHYSEAENSKNRALRRKIMAAKANTLAGLIFKATIVMWCSGNDLEEVDDLVDRRLSTNDLSDEAMIYSIGRDLAYMAYRSGRLVNRDFEEKEPAATDQIQAVAA